MLTGQDTPPPLLPSCYTGINSGSVVLLRLALELSDVRNSWFMALERDQKNTQWVDAPASPTDDTSSPWGDSFVLFFLLIFLNVCNHTFVLVYEKGGRDSLFPPSSTRPCQYLEQRPLSHKGRPCSQPVNFGCGSIIMEEILRDKKDKTLLTTIELAIALSADEGEGQMSIGS